MKKVIYILSGIILVLAISLCFSLYLLLQKNGLEDNSIKGRVVASGFVNSHKKQTKRILFIGNSITWHPVTDYWFGAWGMAASERDKDYVHLLVKRLSNKFNILYTVLAFAPWEVNAHDRGEFLPLLDESLSINNQFIIIQVGENATDTTTLHEDFDELIKYIKNKNKDAKIVVIGTFYFFPSAEKENAKKNVCNKYGLTYIDLSDIDNSKYYFGKGNRLYGADKKYHDITHSGVWKHPNDKAMKVYADRIYDAIMEK